MRKGCEKKRSSEIGIVDRVNELGAMVRAVAPKVFSDVLVVDGVIVIVLLIKKQSQEIAKVC